MLPVGMGERKHTQIGEDIVTSLIPPSALNTRPGLDGFRDEL